MMLLHLNSSDVVVMSYLEFNTRSEYYVKMYYTFVLGHVCHHQITFLFEKKIGLGLIFSSSNVPISMGLFLSSRATSLESRERLRDC